MWYLLFSVSRAENKVTFGILSGGTGGGDSPSSGLLTNIKCDICNLSERSRVGSLLLGLTTKRQIYRYFTLSIAIFIAIYTAKKQEQKLKTKVL